MEAFLIYQLKVAVIAAVLYLLYRVCLSKQTFHGFNRAMLLLICGLSFILPVCKIDSPELAANVRNALHIHASTASRTSNGNASRDHNEADDWASNEATSHTSTEAGNWGSAAEAEGADMQSDALASAPVSHDGRHIVLGIFAVWCVGFALMMGRKAVSLISVFNVIKKGKYADRQDECDLIESDSVSQPVNWMKVVMMPHDWLAKENESVWRHEISHAHKAHSIDLLIVDMMQLMQWFNPVMYLLYKEIELVHEFQADKAVIDSGANAREYKLMLVNAVAESRGLAMANWLRQTNLKQRIDMMQKNESKRWSRLRALFIPFVAIMFVVLNTAMAYAQEQNNHWPVFEDGKVWIFKDGSAKVKTFDNVEANMKISDVAKYLRDYQGYRTTRMTLMYMYPIDGLAQAQPLAEQLAKVGIRINVANNEDMLKRMTMPEFRVVRIYGPQDDGKYRFEMICNDHDERKIHAIRNSSEPYTYQDLSIQGDVKLMLKWIDLFDGHGLAIYPSEEMPLQELQKFANAAWKRGIEQVSVVEPREGSNASRVTLIPQNTNLAKEYGKASALETVRTMNRRHTDFPGAEIIENPRYTSSNGSEYIEKVIRDSDKTVIIKSLTQGPDLWIRMSKADASSIMYQGTEYRATSKYGLDGFEDKYYWSPDFGNYFFVEYYPALPAEAQVVDLCVDGEMLVKNLQVSNTVPEDFYAQFRQMGLYKEYDLKTLPKVVTPQGGDAFGIEYIEFSNTETTLKCCLSVFQSLSYPGFVDDFKLTLSDGTILTAIRVEGVPVGKDFDRNGDFTLTRFNVVFPKIDYSVFTDIDSPVTLTCNICHEPVEMDMIPSEGIMQLTKLKEGKFKAHSVVRSEEGEVNPLAIDRFEVREDGTVLISGDSSGLIEDGIYTQEYQQADSNDPNSVTGLTLSSGSKTMTFQAIAQFDDGKLRQIQLSVVKERGNLAGILLIP